jgi:hypothetical protein
MAAGKMNSAGSQLGMKSATNTSTKISATPMTKVGSKKNARSYVSIPLGSVTI